MERGVFQFVLRFSKRDQIVLIIVTLLSLPFYFFSLDLPKQIVDKAIKGEEKGLKFPIEYCGPFEGCGLNLTQLEFLFVLCFLFLALVFINGGFKYFLNVYRGATGERLLRRIRYQLLERVLRFPLPHFRRTSQGEVVSMVTLETEPLGGFFGDAINLPSYQGGLLITLMVFMFVQDWKLGLAAIALYPVQAWLIPKLQRQVNQLGKRRVQEVRRLSERIGEAVTGAHEIHANDTSQYELTDFSSRLGRIYDIRYEIYKKKFFIKFVNNFLALLTPFFFYSIGGWLVIRGDMSIGSLIAVLGAYKDVSAPWKMLLGYYQRLEDARIKYEQLIEKFETGDLLEEEKLTEEPEVLPKLEGPLSASNVSFTEDDGLKIIDGASMTVNLPGHFALVGPPGGGKVEFAQLMARLLSPSGGKITIGEDDFAKMPEAVTGRKIAYAGQSPYIFSGSFKDNLLYGLKHRPVREPEYDDAMKAERVKVIAEARGSGNLDYDPNADWVDWDTVGVKSEDELVEKVIHTLGVVDLESDVYQIGLRQRIDPQAQPDLAQNLLRAREMMRKNLDERHLADFVESFDAQTYNNNASVAKNILFGTPVGEAFEIENLGENAYAMSVLDQVGMREEFILKGQRLAEIMVDLFQGLPPDHEFWERFSFISSDDLPEFQAILKRLSMDGLDNASEEDRAALVELPFKLIPARHHLGLVDDDFRERILEARKVFAENLPAVLRESIEFFEAGSYNAAASIQDNILFGKIASERAESSDMVGEELLKVVQDVGIRTEVIRRGLEFDVGIGGSRLSPIQRQKLAVARSLMKQPDLFILNEALSSLDSESQNRIVGNVIEAQEGRSFMLVPSETALDRSFDHVFKIEGGKVSGQGESAPVASNGESSDDSGSDIGGGFGEEIDVLASIPLFAGMDRSKLKMLAFASERYNYPSGEVVFRQGEVGDNAYVVIDGEADVLLELSEGTRHLVTMKRNDLYGELALLCEAPRTATIKAATDLTVMAIAKDIFFKVIAEDTETSIRLTRSVAERLERTTRDLSDAATIHDAITNLPDQRLFVDHIRQTIARDKRFGEKSGLLWFDIAEDYGTHGSIETDEQKDVLREIGSRIHDCIRETDMAARIGEFKFAIVFTPAQEDGGAKRLATRIVESLKQPISINNHNYQLSHGCKFLFRKLESRDPQEQYALLQADDGEVLEI